MPQIQRNKRVEWIDIAKGITMLLVILGHSVFGVLRGAIFSFHMPLFFILSGMTGRFSANGTQLWTKCKKAFVHLVIPALILFVLTAVGTVLVAGETPFTADFLKAKGLALLFASGSGFPIGSIRVERMGIPWFLIVLFMGRVLLDLLHLKLGRWCGLACIGLSVAGVVIGQFVWLPLSFDVVLVSLGFLWIGYWIRQYDFKKQSLLRFLIVTALWAGALVLLKLGAAEGAVRNYLEMSARVYPLYPLCIFTAVLGTMMVAYLSTMLVRLPAWMRSVMSFIGEHSLMMLCIHTLDFLWEDIYNGIGSKPLIRGVARILIDFVIFVFVLYLKMLIGKRRCKK